MTTPLYFSSRFLVLSAGFLLMAGCGRYQVKRQIEASIAANQSSKSLAQWETSALHPSNMIKKWQSEKVDGRDLCTAFEERADLELTLFEESLSEDPAFQELVATCRDRLSVRIEKYWELEAQTIQVSDVVENKFQTKIIYRDVSKGYATVDAGLSPRQVLLTFDDGPHATLTDSILDTLARYNVKALFFSLGKNAKAHPETLKRVALGGHSIGSHSQTHADLGRMARTSPESAKKEIIDGHASVFSVLGWVDPFFRFPYGSTHPELKAFLRERGVGEFFWTVDSEDWKNKSPEKVVSDTMSILETEGKGILLFHDIQKRTSLALPLLLETLFENGYTPVLLRATDVQVRSHNQMTQK